MASAAIDMTPSLYDKLASRLTEDDCRTLVTSLYLCSYDLPNAIENALKKLPYFSCIELLLIWNSGHIECEGQGKSHDDIQRRLRQLGKTKLADWLSTAVYRQLTQDISDILLENYSMISTTSEVPSLTIIQTLPLNDSSWFISDVDLWVIFIVSLVAFIFLVCKSIYISYKGSKKKQNQSEDVIELLRNECVIIEDDEKDEGMNISEHRTV